MERWVAFFRNVYNGRPNNPNKEQLEEAFLQAGAVEANSFLANGTVVITLPEGADITEVDRRASAFLLEACNLREPAMYRSMAALKQVLRLKPFEPWQDNDLEDEPHDFYICLTDKVMEPGVDLPLYSSRKDCLIAKIDGQDAFAVNFVIDGKAGYPTRLLEREFGCLATTRNWRTLERLVKNFG